VLLDVLTFQTPNATTVDSSWIDARALQPLRAGYRARMPVYIDRFDRVVWYAVVVVQDTSLVRASGYEAPMWEVLATADSAAPSARFWVSQRHRFVDRVLVWEPGVSIMYAR
jgi:hypothetical protein